MKIILIFIVAIFLFAASGVLAGSVNAQVFKLQLANPAQSIKVGDTVPVNLYVNTANQPVINADAVMIFDTAKISIDAASGKTVGSPPLFYYFYSTIIGGSNNKLMISNWEASVANAKKTNSDTQIGTFNIVAKDAGSTQITFYCTDPDKGGDSSLNRDDYADIIKCSSLTPLAFNIGQGTVPTTAPTAVPTAVLTPGPTNTPAATPTLKPTSTPRPTSTPAPSNTPRPTPVELTRAGAVEMTVAALGIGTLLTVVGILFIL